MTYTILIPDNVNQKAIDILSAVGEFNVIAPRNMSRDETLAAIRDAGLRLERPDYAALARRILEGTPDDVKDLPAARYLALMSETTADHLPLLSALLADVYAMDTPTTRIFQTHTLGSARYTAAYGDPAPFDSESTLATCDQPLLAPDTRDRLLAWHALPGNAAVIFTARPSLPPAGTERVRANVFSPEAELALELIGLDGQIPLIAQGRVGWLAQQRGRSAADYVKPSPVQALAAIGAAIWKTRAVASPAARGKLPRMGVKGEHLILP